MLTDIRIPLPPECEGQADAHRHLSETSDRLTGNLRARLGDGFEVLRDVRPVVAGGRWTRATRVYRDGELRATFAVDYDWVISPHDFAVSCRLEALAADGALPRAPAFAASLLTGVGAGVFAGPAAGALAGGAALMVALLAARVRPSRRRQARADAEAGLPDLRLDPLLG
jgi:hypothetical protein